MPIDTSFLLGAKPVTMPDPMTFATQGVNLATMASQNAIRQLAAQEAARRTAAEDAYAAAAPELYRQNFSPDAMLAAITGAPPGTAGLVQTEAEKRQQSQATIGKLNADALKSKAEAQIALAKPLSDMAWQLRNDPNLTPDKIKQWSNAVASNGLENLLPTVPFQAWSNPDSARDALGLAANAFYDVHQRVQNDETFRNHLVTEKTAALAQAATERYQQGELGLKQRGLQLEAEKEDPFGMTRMMDIASGGGMPSNAVPGFGGGMGGGQGAPAPGGRTAGAAPWVTAGPGGVNLDPSLTPEQRAMALRDAASTPNAPGVPGGPPGGAPGDIGATPVGGGMTLRDAVQSGLRGQDLLNTLPTPLKNSVQQILDGREPAPNSYGQARSPYLRSMMQIANMVDPTFDATTYQTRLATRKQFTSGQTAQSITAMNTIPGHMLELERAARALDNTGANWYNALVNPVVGGVSQDFKGKLNAFNIAVQAVSTELERAYRGTGGNLTDILAWKNAMSNADGPDAVKAGIATAARLLESRLDALNDAYQRGMGKPADAFEFVSPKSRKVFDYFEGSGQNAGGATGDFGGGAVDMGGGYSFAPSTRR